LKFVKRETILSRKGSIVQTVAVDLSVKEVSQRASTLCVLARCVKLGNGRKLICPFNLWREECRP